jgi:hypothetical protein
MMYSILAFDIVSNSKYLNYYCSHFSNQFVSAPYIIYTYLYIYMVKQFKSTHKYAYVLLASYKHTATFSFID